MDDEGVYPDMVQIGNEIRCGMIWPEGKTSNWPMLARFINVGIKAVRDTQKDRDTKVSLPIFPEEVWHEYEVEFEMTDNDLSGSDKEIEIGLRMDSPISFGAVKNVKLFCC